VCSIDKLSVKAAILSTKNVTVSESELMPALGTFNARYLDSEMMGKSRAIAAIEPIQADAVPVAALRLR
jgi:hypothetical protein